MCFFKMIPSSAHSGPVRGVAIDGLNQVIVTGGADAFIKFWKFKTKEVIETSILPAQVAKLLLHRERCELLLSFALESVCCIALCSSMLAVAQDDFKVVVLDLDTRKVVRNFANHTATVNDMVSILQLSFAGPTLFSVFQS
jgi:U3 small nucleolar RNA-associated protein 21